MTKKIFILLLLFLSIQKSYGQNPNKIELLKEILNLKEFVEVLALNDLTDMGPVRIFDNSKKFKNVSFPFKLNTIDKGPFLPVITIHNIPMDWNMGSSRDIYIDSYKKLKNGNYKISIYLTNYLCIGKKKSKLVFHGECSYKDGQVLITSKEFNTWH